MVGSLPQRVMASGRAFAKSTPSKSVVRRSRRRLHPHLPACAPRRHRESIRAIGRRTVDPDNNCPFRPGRSGRAGAIRRNGVRVGHRQNDLIGKAQRQSGRGMESRSSTEGAKRIMPRASTAVTTVTIAAEARSVPRFVSILMSPSSVIAVTCVSSAVGKSVPSDTMKAPKPLSNRQFRSLAALSASGEVPRGRWSVSTPLM